MENAPESNPARNNPDFNQQQIIDKIESNPHGNPAIGIRLYETYSDDTMDPFAEFQGKLQLKYADPRSSNSDPSI